MTRKQFTFTAKLAKSEAADEYLVTMLVGNGTYNGLFCPTEEVAKAASSWDGQPLNLDHSAAVEDEVGFVKHPQMFDDALKAILVLNGQTAKYAVAKAYIDNRLAAGKVPEVSVGFYCDVEEDDEKAVARNMAGDHLALVTRGACSPENGCGIGLSATTNTAADFTFTLSGCACSGNSNMTTETPPPAETVAPAAEPTVEAPTNEAPEASPCHCEEALKQRIADLEAQLAEAPKRYALAAEAESLGIPVEASDRVECLTKKLAIARAVLAKAPKADPAPVRGTATGAGHKQDEATRLFRLMQ